MKIYISTILFNILFVLNMQAQTAQFEKPESNTINGEIIVMVGNSQKMTELLNRFQKFEGVETHIVLKEIIAREQGIYLLSFDYSKVSQVRLLNQIKTDPTVLIAQNNHTIKQRTTPDDTYFGNMWSMNNTGTSGGLTDADIDAPEAWDIATGGLTSTGDTIVVAIIDGGFYLSQVDLNFWKNYAEVPANGIDDDNNGYIDDVDGWNASTNTGSITNDSHGTHVCGIAGAKGNNNIGVAGVNWGVKIMPVQYSSTAESEIVRAYTYVLKQRRIYNQTNGAQGAFVVTTNSSFGVDLALPSNYPLWCAMYDSLGYEGILSAAATANANYNVDTQSDIPTACASNFLISVTNTTNTDTKYGGAAYGLTTIDLGAPGTAIWSTLPSNQFGGSTWTGTSMASPHVAGTVALMLSAASPSLVAQYKQNPDSVALIFKDWLLCGADPISSLNGKTVTGGRLNLFKSISNVNAESCIVTNTRILDKITNTNSIASIYPNPTRGVSSVQYQLNSTGRYTFKIFDQLGKLVLEIEREAGYPGIRQHTIDVTPLQGGIYFIAIEKDGYRTNMLKLVKL